MMTTSLSRRSALRTLAGSAALLGATGLTPALSSAVAAEVEKAQLKGNIKHSVSRWCYGKISLEDLCKACVKMGIESVELLGEKEWPVVKQFGLTCAMCNGPDSIGYGFNRVEHHDKLVQGFTEMLPKVAGLGFPNIICFSGNRGGMSNEQGLENCVTGLKKVAGLAETHKVTIILELLNSKVDHKDYMADHSAWGVELCKRVGSERVKLLYDIYHMQIMEGDVIRTIKANAKYFGHYHTGGNPGRNEIDETQELNYPAVMKAIASTGYKGYVGQEFVPVRDPLTSLQQAITLCDI
jgi:hydroxypyruvate isomerase